MAESEHNLGSVFQLSNKLVEAEEFYDRAVSVRAALVRDHPHEDRYQNALAQEYVNLALMYQRSNRLAKATQTYEKIEELLLPLAARQPPREEHTLLLAAAYANWGFLLRAEKDFPTALDKHTKAVELTEAVLRLEPEHSTARHRAFNAHGARAQFYEALGRFKDAVPDWDRVVELDPQPNPWLHRVLRALTLARAGAYVRATDEAQKLEADPDVTAEGRYNLACAYALAIAPARTDSRESTAQRTILAERYATQGMAILQKLQATGYFKDAKHAHALQIDADLESLRARDDFQQLLRGVRRNAPTR